MSKLTVKQAELQETKEKLLQLLEKADYKVYTTLDHVSQSGMSRRISAYVSQPDGTIININWYIQELGLYKIHPKGGLKVSGCGSDMGFEVVYNLSSYLFRNEDGSYSHDGAYKLKQRWL